MSGVIMSYGSGMPPINEYREEKTELETVLSSGTFLKSPSLGKLLRYVCTKYFEDRASDLKEYNIGVDAMGRPPDFDPTANSVVRVEAHRLREKLKKYYENEGACHPTMITLQVGHYVPQFVKRDSEPSKVTKPAPGASHGNGSDAIVNLSAEAIESQGPLTQQFTLAQSSASSVLGPGLRKHGRFGKLLSFTAVALLLGAALTVWKFKQAAPGKIDSAEPRQPEKVLPGSVDESQEVRILAGYSKQNHIDRSGKVWRGDRYFTGGKAVSQPRRFIARTLDPTMYQTFRSGDFSYDIPLKPGIYELRLYFIEPQFGPDTYIGGGESSRIFSIKLNSTSLLDDLDILGDAGGNNTSYVRVFKDISPSPDGLVHLQFVHSKDEALLNALEIVPAVPGKIHPVRIVAQDSSYTDRKGRVWSPDSYFSGGVLIHHKAPQSGTPDPDLYSGERYGNFSYALPVAPGKYTVTLRFAETYFGAGNPGAGGIGSRIFDVYCNGITLLRHFDIFKEAGGANVALDKTFKGLEPNAQGNLLLIFVPVKNYACLNAIEVVEEPE